MWSRPYAFSGALFNAYVSFSRASVAVNTMSSENFKKGGTYSTKSRGSRGANGAGKSGFSIFSIRSLGTLRNRDMCAMSWAVQLPFGLILTGSIQHIAKYMAKITLKIVMSGMNYKNDSMDAMLTWGQMGCGLTSLEGQTMSTDVLRSLLMFTFLIKI